MNGLRSWLHVVCRVLELSDYLLPPEAMPAGQQEQHPPPIIPLGMPGDLFLRSLLLVCLSL